MRSRASQCYCIVILTDKDRSLFPTAVPVFRWSGFTPIISLIVTDIHVLHTIFNTRVGEIRVHCTATNISGFLSRLKKKVFEMLYFGWQIRVTPHEYVLRSTSKLCWCI